MPIFRYHCPACQLDFELLLSRFDSQAFCPNCGNEHPEKLPSLIGGINSAGNHSGCPHAEACASGHQCDGHCCHGK